MTKGGAHIITKNSVIVNVDGHTHSVLKGNPEYDKVLDAIGRDAWDEIPVLVNRSKFIEKQSDGNFRVSNGEIFVDGNKKVPAGLTKQILTFIDEKLPFKHLVEFARNLLKNPSEHSVQQLFDFLEHNEHPITSDGKFIAYKSVSRLPNGKLVDSHTKTFANDPGCVVEMERHLVDSDPNQTCSTGLHVANWDYAKNIYGSHHGNDTMLQVVVDPGDVVAVPTDYNQSKMRVCRYVVDGIVQNPNENLHVVPESERVEYVMTSCEKCDSTGVGEDELACTNCNGEGQVEEKVSDSKSSYDDEDSNDEDDDYDDDDDEDEDEDSVEVPEYEEPVPFYDDSVPFHTEQSIRKMSSSRLANYSVRLGYMSEDKKDTKIWVKTKSLVQQVLTARGYLTNNNEEE